MTWQPAQVSHGAVDPWSNADPWQTFKAPSNDYHGQSNAARPANEGYASSQAVPAYKEAQEHLLEKMLSENQDSGQQGLDVSGTYIDTWRGSEPVVELVASGSRIHVVDPSGKYGDETGTLDGNRISFWGITGTVQQSRDGACQIDWDNKACYKRVQAMPHRQAHAAAAEVEDHGSCTYIDDWQNTPIAVLHCTATSVRVEDPSGKYGVENGSLSGDRIAFWGLEGNLQRTSSGYTIAWANGSTWSRDSSTAPAPAHNPWDVTAEEGAQSWSRSGNEREWASTDTGGASQAAGVWVKESRPEPGPPPRNLDDANSGGDPKIVARWREFQMHQTWCIQDGILPGKTREEEQAEEATIFQHGAQAGEGIDFELYDLVPCNVTGPGSESCTDFPKTFDELFEILGEYLPQDLKHNIQRCGYKKPTPVQRFAIPSALLGRDVMCCAQTGSGKTAAFLIPVLASMMKNIGDGVGSYTEPFKGPCSPDAIVMSPTRELCLQIYGEALKFLHLSTFRSVRVYGQEAAKTQIEQLAKGADLVVATPGRLWDFVSSGIISVENVNTLVMDEADRMLEMEQDGFFRDVVEKFGMPAKSERQTLMFSATFPEPIQKLATDYLYEHLFVSVGTIGTPAVTVTQKFLKVTSEEKFDKLLEVVYHWLDHRNDDERMLIFVNSKNMAKYLNEQLWEKKIDIGALHGDLNQVEREDNLKKFREGLIDVLVATDVASRGLDIKMVRHVINFDLPREIDVYVQRIGRTGRIGHRGNATTFVVVNKDTGEFMDSAEVLQQIPDTLKDCPQAMAYLPDWLVQKACELKKGSWRNDCGDENNQSDARPWESWQSVSAESNNNNGSWQ